MRCAASSTVLPGVSVRGSWVITSLTLVAMVHTPFVVLPVTFPWAVDANGGTCPGAWHRDMDHRDLSSGALAGGGAAALAARGLLLGGRAALPRAAARGRGGAGLLAAAARGARRVRDPRCTLLR